MNEARCLRLVKNAIKKFHLDLRKLRVLTEAASGYYMLTPLIAAMAGAERVFAVTSDSIYGKAAEVSAQTIALAETWGVSERIDILFSREDERVGQADIATNLGFVRPFDKSFLQRLNRRVVIPLMWETWEFRAEEFDLDECHRLDIPVLGTNEHHRNLETFSYLGQIALKLMLKLDIEVFRSTILLIGSGEFAQHTRAVLNSVGCEVIGIAVDSQGIAEPEKFRRYAVASDAIVICEHHSRASILGPEAVIQVDELYALNSSLVIAHICGNVDHDSLTRAGFQCCPDRFAASGHMSVATDFVGPRPLIELHTAGLKVGEDLCRARKKGGSAKDIELRVAESNPLAQAFEDEIGK